VTGEAHLQVATTAIGYTIETEDGAIGHVQNILVDDKAWAIRNLLVDTTNRWAAQGEGEVLIMFMILFVVLLVAWLLGWFTFHVAGGLIHILLVVAVIALVVHFVRGRA